MVSAVLRSLLTSACPAFLCRHSRMPTPRLENRRSPMVSSEFIQHKPQDLLPHFTSNYRASQSNARLPSKKAYILFLFVSSHLCPPLPSDLQSPATPLLWTNSS